MFIILEILRGGNIATPTVYIFVFVNEVCNKISARFPSLIYTSPRSNSCTPKYFPEKCLPPWLQNISPVR